MDRATVQRLLDGVAAGTVSVPAAVEALAIVPYGFEDLGFARLDHHRALRTGDPEVVYGAGKSPEPIVALLEALRRSDGQRPALATRLTVDALEQVRTQFPDALVDEEARAVAVGALPTPTGCVTVVSAGTSDGPIAAEAAFTARVFGAGAQCIRDVGVAGMHRLLSVRGDLEAADCLVVVAGMEGALPSVVGGIVGTPVVAVPTSVGYGASYGGLAALLAMLNSCPPGVAVCNVDNG